MHGGEGLNSVQWCRDNHEKLMSLPQKNVSQKENANLRDSHSNFLTFWGFFLDLLVNFTGTGVSKMDSVNLQ